MDVAMNVGGRWEKDQGVKRGSSGKFFYKGQPSMVSFMGDTRSELTQALDMVLDDEGVMGALGNPRCKRFALASHESRARPPHSPRALETRRGLTTPAGCRYCCGVRTGHTARE